MLKGGADFSILRKTSIALRPRNTANSLLRRSTTAQEKLKNAANEEEDFDWDHLKTVVEWGEATNAEVRAVVAKRAVENTAAEMWDAETAMNDQHLSRQRDRLMEAKRKAAEALTVVKEEERARLDKVQAAGKDEEFDRRTTKVTWANNNPEGELHTIHPLDNGYGFDYYN